MTLQNFIVRAAFISVATFTVGLKSYAEPIKTNDLISKISECLAQSSMDEFDDVESALERLSKPCSLKGVFRRTAPILPGLGHQIQYNPNSKAFEYYVVPDIDFNYRYGTTISPYATRFMPNQRKHLQKSLRRELKNLGNQGFWYFPLIAQNDVTDSYEATNAYGASIKVHSRRGDRYSLVIPVDWKTHLPVLIASFPISQDDARSAKDDLLLEVEFGLQRACDTCFTANEVKFGTSTPTFTEPYDIELTHYGAYAYISKLRLVDGESGSLLGESDFEG